MPYCEVRQANIYYEDIGEGKPIIMIHGYSVDHQLMKRCMEPLFDDREGYRRIYLDLPGMGLTENYDDINSADDMLNAVEDFIQAILTDQEFIIAGESYGGYMARGVIQNQNDRILGAAFICPVIFPYQKNRVVEKHQIFMIDEQFITSLSEEELESFKKDSVILDGVYLVEI